MSEEIKNIIEILELAKEEIENNDENITATLDLQDLKSLKKLYDLYNEEKDKNNDLEEENKEIIDYHYKNDSLLDLYNKEKEKNKELEEENSKFYNGELYTAKQLKNYEKTIKTYWVNKKIIKEKADDYESKGYIEIAGAMRELLEERN